MPTLKFTKANVRTANLPDGKSKIAYSDSACKGLVLEVRSTGGRTFYYRYHDERGRQKHVKIGDATVVSLAAARKQVEQLASERAQGRDPAVKPGTNVARRPRSPSSQKTPTFPTSATASAPGDRTKPTCACMSFPRSASSP